MPPTLLGGITLETVQPRSLRGTSEGLRNPSGKRKLPEGFVHVQLGKCTLKPLPLNDFHASLNASDFTVSYALASARATYVVSCIGAVHEWPRLLELTWTELVKIVAMTACHRIVETTMQVAQQGTDVKKTPSLFNIQGMSRHARPARNC